MIRSQRHKSASKGILLNCTEERFVLVARDDFCAVEKLYLRWSGSRRIVEAMNDYVYRIQDLRNGTMNDVHVSHLKFNHVISLNMKPIMPHVLASETGMIF